MPPFLKHGPLPILRPHPATQMSATATLLPTPSSFESPPLQEQQPATNLSLDFSDPSSEELVVVNGKPGVVVHPRRKAGEPQRRKRTPVVLTKEFLEDYRYHTLPAAAESMGISATALTNACRRLGIMRWPTLKLDKKTALQPVGAQAAASAHDHYHAVERTGLPTTSTLAPSLPPASKKCASQMDIVLDSVNNAFEDFHNVNDDFHIDGEGESPPYIATVGFGFGIQSQGAMQHGVGSGHGVKDGECGQNYTPSDGFEQHDENSAVPERDCESDLICGMQTLADDDDTLARVTRQGHDREDLVSDHDQDLAGATKQDCENTDDDADYAAAVLEDAWEAVLRVDAGAPVMVEMTNFFAFLDGPRDAEDLSE
jgi:hypothetical protein